MKWLQIPKGKWRRRIHFVACTLLILLAIDLVWVQFRRRITIAPQTTVITSPISADGTPDYLAALNARWAEGVTLANNAAIPLLEVFGTADRPEAWRKQVLPALGLPAAGTPGRLFRFPEWLNATDPLGELFAKRIKDPGSDSDLMTQKPWKRADHPEWTAWLDAHDDRLEKARAAVTRPHFHIPHASTHTGSRALVAEDFFESNIFGMEERTLADLLLSDAQRCLGEGDFEGFKTNILATTQLARLVVHNDSLMNLLVSSAIESRVCRAINALAGEPDAMTAAQGRSLLAGMDTLKPLPSPEAAFDITERWRTLNEFCYGAANGTEVLNRRWQLRRIEKRMAVDHVLDAAILPQKSFSTQTVALLVPLNYNHALRETNLLFDRIVANLRIPGYLARLESLKRIEEELTPDIQIDSLLSTNHPARLYVYAFDIPSSAVKSTILLQQTAVLRDLARVSIALGIYRHEKGAYPEALSALKDAGILSEVPLDGNSGQPLIYRSQNGEYLLYSVGQNGKDDGGRGTWIPDMAVRSGTAATQPQ